MMGQSDNGCHEKVVYSQNGHPISQMNVAVHAQHISFYLATDFCSFFELELICLAKNTIVATHHFYFLKQSNLESFLEIQF